MKQPSLLIIGAVWPEPTASAAGTRMLQLIRAYQRANFIIRFACVTETQQQAVDLSMLNIESCVIKPNDSMVDAQFAQWDPDFVMFDRFYIEEQFGWRIRQQCPNAVKILDTEDLHSLRQARHALAKQSPDQLITTQPEFIHSDIGLREVAAIARCDIALLISDIEMQLLSEQFPAIHTQLHYCPFMLDAPELPHDYSQQLTFEQRQDIVWIGNFLHEPNWDAVRFLRQKIWPSIHQKLPNVAMKIYGAYMPDKAKQLHNEAMNFHVLGRAPDAKTVIEEARLLLAPIRFGAGLKGKLIEAMQCGTPSICTEIAAEGIAGEYLWPGAISETIDDLIDKTIQLYTDKTAWKTKQALAIPILQHRFNAKHEEKRLVSTLIEKQNNLQMHRKKNLLGALLNHHNHRSTEYMSRWIESKNELLELKSNQSQSKTTGDA